MLLRTMGMEWREAWNGIVYSSLKTQEMRLNFYLWKSTDPLNILKKTKEAVEITVFIG